MDLIALLSKGGALVVLAVVLVLLIRGDLVPGYLYRKQGKERDMLFELAMRGTEYAERALVSAQRAREDAP